ncbi:hypothetical protein ACFL6S_34840, partial [Candidatus Poribacteria bacterium]
MSINFAQRSENDYDYEPLFVHTDLENFSTSFDLIPPNRKYLFFVDDAHEFYKHYGELKALLNSQAYEGSKVILITREPFKEFVKGNFLFNLSPEAIDELAVRSLEREKTSEFIKKYSGIGQESLLNHLTSISRDTPLIAVMAIELYKKGRDLNEISKDKLIEATFKSYLGDLFSKNLPESDDKHRKMLEWISGIEPVDIDDEKIFGKLAEALGVELHESQKIQQQLTSYGLLTQHGRKIRIFPDQLSDYILRKACFLDKDRLSVFHEELLKRFLPIAPTRVIRNLAKAEHITGSKSLLDLFVLDIKSQSQHGNNLVRYNIVNSIEGLCYFRPMDALEIFNTILDNPNTEDHIQKDKFFGEYRITHLFIIQKVAKEIRKTIYTLNGYVETLNTIRKLLLLEEPTFQHSDSPAQLLKDMLNYQTGKSFIFHHEALDLLGKWGKEDTKQLSIPVLDALKSLFAVEFSETSSQGGAIVITWQRLRYNAQLAELRQKAMNVLETILYMTKSDGIKEKAIECIQDSLRPHRMRPDIEPEITDKDLELEHGRIFQILGRLLQEETSFRVLNSIEVCLNYCQKFAGEFVKQKAVELLADFSKLPNLRKYMFYREFIGRPKDWDRTPLQLEKFLRKYLQQYKPPELAKLMFECIRTAESGWDYGSATFFMFTIGRMNPVYGDELLDCIVAWQINESHYASGLLNG